MITVFKESANFNVIPVMFNGHFCGMTVTHYGDGTSNYQWGILIRIEHLNKNHFAEFIEIIIHELFLNPNIE